MQARYIILDDDIHSSLLLSEQVSRLRPGYELAAIVEETTEAERILMREEFDLIFSEVMMSDGSALPMLRRVGHRHLIIISSEKNHRQAASACLPISFLLKPVESGELLEAIERFERMSGRGFANQSELVDAGSKKHNNKETMYNL